MNASRQQRYRRLAELVARAKRIVLATHERADGDAFGSLLAFRQLVLAGRTVVALAPESSPSGYAFLPGIETVVTEAESVTVDDADLVMLFDCGDVQRTHLAEKLYFLGAHRPFVALLDHHPTRTTWRDRQLVDLAIVETAASSTSELVAEYCAANGISVSPAAATALLTGIVTDTGGFQNLSTTLEAMETAAELLKRGANLRRIVQATMRTKSLRTLQLWGRALERLVRDPATGTVSTALTLQDLRECGVDLDSTESTEGIANFLNSLEDARIILVLREKSGGLIKGSLRTKQPDVNVADLAAVYGGGGHTKAAGFTVAGEIVRGERGWSVQEKK
ncbi:MAG: bifunctional oligoribonuclease/PAP phosphatase NrnA [Candidatus Kerfeldbacteria bacterium]|nr:bifunctional oligoribonuclease/PAP phosphatase NrnA [Candidatus Kerfeldbacteria bacterium]